MTRTIITLATLLAAAGIANAQTTTPSAPSATTPPSGGSSTTMPGSGGASGGAGAMSATAVKSKIEASGYSNVTGLKQDATGGWTAKASKGGQQVAVSVDATGMVKEAQQ